MNDINDLMQEDAGKSQESTLENLSALGYQQIEREKELVDLQLLVTKKEAEVKKLRNDDIPKILNDLGMSEFSLKTGEKFKVKKSYFGSIKNNEEQYFEYLEKYDLDDIIKNIITITFSKDEQFKAKELVEGLAEMGYKEVENKRTIHSATLKSHIKEKMEGLQELKDSYIEQGGLPCSMGDKNWEDYLKFAQSRNQEDDLMFPSDLCKSFIVEQAKITVPKK